MVGPPAQGRSPLGRSPRWRVLLVVGGGRLGARVRRAVAGTPAVTVVGEVPGLAGVAVAATELAPVVVVTATGSALPAGVAVGAGQVAGTGGGGRGGGDRPDPRWGPWFVAERVARHRVRR